MKTKLLWSGIWLVLACFIFTGCSTMPPSPDTTAKVSHSKLGEPEYMASDDGGDENYKDWD